MVVTGWILLADKKPRGSDAHCIVTDAATPFRRLKTTRRYAVGSGKRLAASSPSTGLLGPLFGPFLSSRFPEPISTTSYSKGRP